MIKTDVSYFNGLNNGTPHSYPNGVGSFKTAPQSNNNFSQIECSPFIFYLHCSLFGYLYSYQKTNVAIPFYYIFVQNPGNYG